MKTINNRLGVFQFLLAFVPLMLVIGASFYGYLNYRNGEVMSSLRAEQNRHLSNAFFRLTSQFESIVSDLFILAKSENLKDYVDSKASKSDLARTLTLIARERRIYDKIRYISASGREEVAINYDGERPYLEWPSNLSNISDRFYFQQTLSLRPGMVYISDFEPHSIGEKIERPLKPIIRVATPIYNGTGGAAGIVVLNVRGNAILDLIRAQWEMSSGIPLVVTDRGQFVLAADKSQEWGEFLGHDTTFGSRYGDVWGPISREANGEQLTSSGLFSFRTLSAPLIARAAGVGNRVAMSRVDRNGIGRDYSLKVIGHVPQQVISRMTRITPYNWLMFGLSTFGALSISLVFAGIRTSQLRSQQRVKLAAHVEKVTRDGVIIYDLGGQIVSINPAFTVLTGYLPHEAVGRQGGFFRVPVNQQQNGEAEDLLVLAEKNSNVVRETMVRRRDGSVFPVSTNVSVVRNRSGGIANFIEIFTDVTHLKHKENTLVRQAYYDALTAIPNRLLFEDRLKVAMNTCARRNEKFALLFIDLDDFKKINDEYGHEAGDCILREVAQRLSEAIRESDTVARLGGDEFVIIAQNIENAANARVLATKISEHASVPVAIDDTATLSVSVSIGISLFPDDGEDYSHLTKIADFDMYRQKAQHKSQAVLSRVGVKSQS